MMNPTQNSLENQQAGGGTAPDSETQSSAASAQGHRNNPEQSEEFTGADASGDKAEGGRSDASTDVP